jgi:cell division protein FtsZ
MFEVDEAARIISGAADPDANIIFGAVIKPDLTDQVRITVIATGFDETRSRIAQMRQPAPPPIVQGVVSEPIRKNDTDEDEGEERNEPPEDQGDDNDGDTFGEKFEIPAFLRKIR